MITKSSNNSRIALGISFQISFRPQSQARRLVAYVIAVLMSISLSTGTASASSDQAAWSEASNGLRARLSTRRSHVSNGTGIVVTHLELNNVSDMGTPMLVTVHRQSLTFSVTDADGRNVPVGGSSYSGMDFGTPELVLPYDSTIRFRIGPRGWGIPADQAALVDLGSSFGWALPRDGKAYYLQAVLDIAEVKDDRSERGTRWQGRLDLPRVRIPTESEGVDPATLGPLIDELGAKMLAKDSRVSETAVRELSLIDDARVILWYVKALKTDSYNLKFKALDRLSRLGGDDALDGLKIGMATRGDDIGNCTTPAVAADLAINIRHQAAIALARSPHPQAKVLLLSMENDPATAVRITVIQAAGRMKTPESLTLLKRRAQDNDPAVRGEAARLLELRGNSSEP
jgi:HEAT repeat protein